MRAAIVTPTLSHFEVPLFRLAASLDGIDVRVYHRDANAGVRSRYDADYNAVIDWGEDLTAGYSSHYSPSTADLRSDLWSWKPDVILQYGYAWRGALQLLADAWKRRVPVVHRGLLSPYPDPRAGVASRVWRQMRPFLLRRFRAHHYGGTYSRRVLAEAGVPKSCCYFIPFSVDSPHFARMADDPVERQAALELRAQLGWSPDAPVVLFICQHSWFKGPDLMLEAFALAQARRPGLKLIMAGNGKMSDQLVARAREALEPGSFCYPGYVSSKSTVPYYLAADVAVFPSRYDTWSRAVNEAMLCTCPCIVSYMVPAAGGLVNDEENGLVVRGLDPASFADRIVGFFEMSSEARRRMGEAARSRALEFSYEAHVDDLRRSLTEVLS